MEEKTEPRARPCAACPYRQDAPSGLWAASEYDKLPPYDGQTWEQPQGLFMCHSGPDKICAGWAGCHDMENNLAVRLAASRGEIELNEVTGYVSPVPLFASGIEAAEHGKRDLEAPSERTQKKAVALSRAISRRHSDAAR
jgi:hypothetical protein